jgi:RsiW-degrading membrane proteinase PrsW (M82 family)
MTLRAGAGTVTGASAPPHPRSFVAVVPVLLLVAGLGFMLASTNGEAWQIVLIWIGAAVAFGFVWRSLERGWVRIAVAVVVAFGLMVLAWEGGLLVLPALVAAAVTPASRAGRGAR